MPSSISSSWGARGWQQGALSTGGVLAGALLALALLAPGAQASTWYIYPTIYNELTSTDTSECDGEPGTGCIQRGLYSITDGKWLNGALPGGLHVLPAGQSDQISFKAPYVDRGADAAFDYTAPGNNSFVVAVHDDVNGVYPVSFPVCVWLTPKVSGSNVCGANFAPGTPWGGENSNLSVHFAFFDASDSDDHYIAAGEICTVPAGAQNFTCAAGAACHEYPTPCSPPASYEGSGWGRTDPYQPMYLRFHDLSSSEGATITVTDAVAQWTNQASETPPSCTLSSAATDNECTIWTSGGYEALRNGLPRGFQPGWSDALQVSNPGSEPAQIAVTAVAEPSYEILLGHYNLDEVIDWYELNGARPDPDVLPSLRRPRVSQRPQGAARRVMFSFVDRKGASTADPAPATTVIRLQRARARAGGGTRWISLPGVRRHASWDGLLPGHSTARACRAAGEAGVVKSTLREGRCHLRVQLRGHFALRNRKGVNRLDISRPGNRRLAHGRYRLTARSLKRARLTRPLHVQFEVR